MKIHKYYQIVDIDKIKIDPDNARKHSPKNIDQIKKSLTKFGFLRPLMVNRETGIINAGNGTYMAALELGLTKVPVIYNDLSPSEAKQYGLADNKLAEGSEWDLGQLAKSVQELDEWATNLDWDAIGFSDDEIKGLISMAEMNLEDDGTAGSDLSGIDDDEKKPVKPIKLTAEQREVIEEALKIMQKKENDDRISEGQLVELLAADFISAN